MGVRKGQEEKILFLKTKDREVLIIGIKANLETNCFFNKKNYGWV